MYKLVKIINVLSLIFFLSCVDDGGLLKTTNSMFFNPEMMESAAVVSEQYLDTIHLQNVMQNGDISLECINDGKSWKLQDTIFSWIPDYTDTGVNVIKIQVVSNNKILDTISWKVTVRGFWPNDCPIYTHKSDVKSGLINSLPNGFFVYNPYTKTGIYKSPINNFSPELIPNTISDRPGNISISDDGKWICYVDLSRNRICLVSSNGCNKTIVPVKDTNVGFPTVAGFYRDSPFGTELFYLASRSSLRSVHVQLGETPIFSNDREIANLQDKYRFSPDYFMQISVVKDQIFAEISPLVNGRVLSRTGFLTIPHNGKGIGSPEDVYKWKEDTLGTVDGCGHTQSHDGSLCLANAGGAIGSNECVPHGHKGFYITEFRRRDDLLIDIQTEHIEKFGISINWCPLEYQSKSGYEADFWGWYFSNSNEFIIGRMMGTAQGNGIFLVKWKDNTWFRLTPPELNVQTTQPAIHFYHDEQFSQNVTCKEDTSEKPLPYDPSNDFFNPHYQIVSPNGGEIFRIADICTVKVKARRSGKAIISMSLDEGLTYFSIPGLNSSIDPLYDTLITFKIPDTVKNGQYISTTISKTCLFYIRDYNNELFEDYSDSYFEIRR